MFRMAIVLIVGLLASRVTAAEMPMKIRKQIDEYFIGDWDFSMKSQDATVQGSFTASWAPGNHCVVVKQEGSGPQGKVNTTGILAWQPDTKMIVHVGFSSNGDYFRIVYDTFEANKWSGKVTGLVNGNRPDDSNANVEWSPKRFVYQDGVFKYEASRNRRAWEASLTNVVGEWKMLVDYQQGQEYDYLLRIQKAGDKLEGVVVSPRSGEHKVKSLEWDEKKNSLSLQLNRNYDGTDVELSFNAQLTEEGFSGDISIEGFGQLEDAWKAKRKDP